MPKIGIRELKAQATAVVRQVREEGVEFVITLRGEPVAVISPAEEAEGKALNAERMELRRRALAVSGQFRSGHTDVSAEHDQHLQEVLEKHLGPRYQVVIPRPVRDALKLKPGDTLLFLVEGDRVTLRTLPTNFTTAMRGLRKELWPADPDAWLDAERDGWA